MVCIIESHHKLAFFNNNFFLLNYNFFNLTTLQFLNKLKKNNVQTSKIEVIYNASIFILKYFNRYTWLMH